MSITDEELEILDDQFSTPSFSTIYKMVAEKYRELMFTDQLNDQQRLHEAKYIAEQLRKYVGSHRAEVMRETENLAKMIAVVDDLIAKANEFSTERREFVYYIMRDEWLMSLRRSIEWIMDQREEDNDV